MCDVLCCTSRYELHISKHYLLAIRISFFNTKIFEVWQKRMFQKKKKTNLSTRCPKQELSESFQASHSSPHLRGVKSPAFWSDVEWVCEDREIAWRMKKSSCSYKLCSVITNSIQILLCKDILHVTWMCSLPLKHPNKSLLSELLTTGQQTSMKKIYNSWIW